MSKVRQLVSYAFPSCPRTIVCIGRNYANHIKELGNTRPSEPFFFLKPPGALLFSPGNDLLDTVGGRSNNGQVLMPKACDLHHEVELAVVLGQILDEWRGGMRELSHVVEGYAVAIDMTARNYQSSAKAKSLPWTLSKGLKTFLPLSDFIPSSIIQDPHNVTLHLEVNGVQKQGDSTNLMLFDIPRLLRHVTSVMPLYKGDLLLTGTPKGVGSVVPGDVITAGVRVDGKEIDEGRIKVEVVERVGGYGSELTVEVN